MSRLIKFFSVIIQSPRVIEHSSPHPDSPTGASAGQDGPAPAGPAGPDFPPGNWLTVDQTGDIGQETEEMVKDLFQTARQEAGKLITKAHEEAGQIVSAGREKLKRVEEEAFRQGWQSGYEEGRKTAEDEYRSKLQEAEDLVARAHREQQRIIAATEDEVVKLAVAVSRKIIDRELATSPEIIVEMVKRAIQKVTDREEITVRVNPENLDSTINAQEEIAQSAKGVRKLRVLSDPAIAPGGCVVESSNGTVDARVERQLEEIEQALRDVSPNA